MSTTIRPAKSLVILAADILAMRAKELLARTNVSGARLVVSADLPQKIDILRDAIHMYTQARIDSEITESMDILLQGVDESLKICDRESLEFERVMGEIESKLNEPIPETTRST